MRLVRNTHQYYDDRGVEYLSVTHLLQELFPIERKYFKDEHRIRGNYVHEALMAILMDMTGAEIYEKSQYWPYIKAGLDFIAQVSPDEIIGFEKIICDSKYLIAGTVDLVLSVNGKVLIIDWKTGAPAVYTAMQIAAYAQMLELEMYGAENGEISGYAVRLKPDGNYSIEDTCKGVPYNRIYWRQAWSAVKVVKNIQRLLKGESK